MKHDCGEMAKLVEYDAEIREWYFLETEFGPAIASIQHCPFCGEELCSDGSTCSP